MNEAGALVVFDKIGSQQWHVEIITLAAQRVAGDRPN